MKVREITEDVDNIYVIEDREGKWLFVLIEYEGELCVARCSRCLANEY